MGLRLSVPWCPMTGMEADVNRYAARVVLTWDNVFVKRKIAW